MKKINLFLATALLCGVGFMSCVNETEMTENDVVKNATRSVVFNIHFPSGDPYHVTRAIQDAAESKITNLWLLVFDANTDLLEKKIDIASQIGDLTDANAQWDGNNRKYVYQPSDAETTAKRFVMIANDAVTDLNIGDTYASITDRQLQRVFTPNYDESSQFSTGLPMYGVAKMTDTGHEIIPMKTGSGANTIDVSVTLTRVVARIDVENAADGLTVTDFKLKNVSESAYMAPHKTAGAVVVPSMLRISGVTAFNPLSSPWLVGNSTTPTIQTKSFYVYEDASIASATQPLTIQVTGNISGIPVYYEIPFTEEYKATPGTTGKSVEIERNHIYKVRLSSDTPLTVNTRVVITLVPVDWDSTTDVNKALSADIFEGEVTTSNGTYDKDAFVFTLNDALAATMTVKVAEGLTSINFTGVEVMTDNIWSTPIVTADDTDADDGGWLKAQFNTATKTATITATANSTGIAREASFRLTYTTSSGTPQKKTFNVVQPAN